MLSNSYVAMLALGGSTAASSPEEQKKAMFMQVGMMVFFGIIFYVMLIRPQQKRAKEQSKMLNELKAGDKVTTSSGIVGIVVGWSALDRQSAQRLAVAGAIVAIGAALAGLAWTIDTPSECAERTVLAFIERAVAADAVAQAPQGLALYAAEDPAAVFGSAGGFFVRVAGAEALSST